MTRLAIISIGTRLENRSTNAGATEICNTKFASIFNLDRRLLSRSEQAQKDLTAGDAARVTTCTRALREEGSIFLF